MYMLHYSSILPVLLNIDIKNLLLSSNILPVLLNLDIKNLHLNNIYNNTQHQDEVNLAS